MSKSKIEWTDKTWNVNSGCTKVSQGCKNCYAEREWGRLSKNPNTVYFERKFTDVMCHPERLEQPLQWKKPCKIFINSMSDLFHDDVPFEFIASVFAVMSVTTRHTYQILTKRPERMLEFFKWVEDGAGVFPDSRISEHLPSGIKWQPVSKTSGGYDSCGPAYPYENVWIGVSVEDQKTADERIPILLDTPAAVRWISVEPLLGEIDLTNIHYKNGYGCSPCEGCGSDIYFNALSGYSYCKGDCDHPVWSALDWVVVGGETGKNARAMHPDWVRSIRDQCKSVGVYFLFKQWGSIGEDGIYRQKSKNGRLLDGQLHDDYPYRWIYE